MHERPLQTIDVEPAIHVAGETIGVPSYSMRQALAWWTAAELTRRHPNNLRIAEWHPMDGQYDCVSLFRRSDANTWNGWDELVHLNIRDPDDHLTGASWFGTSDERFNWLDVLLAPDRRGHVITQLEQLEGLPSPATTPPTTAASIGVRFIAEFLSRSALAPDRWRLLNGYGDSWGGNAAGCSPSSPAPTRSTRAAQ